MAHNADSVAPRTGARVIVVGGHDDELDQRLSDELDAFNAAAMDTSAEELSVRVEADGDLVAGVSGWTWGRAAGVGMTWVREDQRGTGIGAAVITAFEDEARRRGADHCFVTSFSFQAPAFYQRLGYVEIFRWDAVPTTGQDDVHMRKSL
ncbi:GNAT family N-acetyltransferase [Austwickia chelonae]|uniref:GNAT family N-acetyltransferase n=1 Tax=Austwickia chelonae TaxID=100225 RepID=UPI000E2564F4|nr:GNAT family N-acetyltransferase [Austwickia chelonae]